MNQADFKTTLVIAIAFCVVVIAFFLFAFASIAASAPIDPGSSCARACGSGDVVECKIADGKLTEIRCK